MATEITSGTCEMCGTCCRLFAINLNEREYHSGDFKTIFAQLGYFDDFSDAEACGANLLAQAGDGSCIYLTNGKCSIHTRRPQVCRGFFCDTKEPKYQEMVRRIKEYKAN